MPFKLKINTDESAGGGAFERLFYLPEVQIGSATTNELVLNDPQRSISRKHARILREGDGFLIEDTQSRNGTQLNGKSLIPQKPVPLADGDRVRIGPFTMVYSRLVDESAAPVDAGSGDGPTMILIDVQATAREIAAELRATYLEQADADPEARCEALAEVIQRQLDRGGLDPRTRDELLRTVRRMFPNRSYELLRLQKRVERLEVESPQATAAPPLHGAAFEAFVTIAKRLHSTTPEFSTVAEIQRFADSIRATLEVFLRMSHQLLQGRTEWKREFDIEPSVQLRVAHPIKTATSAEGLAAYLYDVKSAEPAQARAELLDEALQGLIYHQVAILAGYEESIKQGLQWVLQELSPQNFSGGSRSLFSGKAPWDKFVERHKELSREDTKRIQARFLTGFNRGYEQKLAELRKFTPHG